jgi:hypothetical protein
MQILHFHRSQPLILLGALLVLVFSDAAHARDLQGRLGVGFNRQFASSAYAGGPPGAAVKYAFTREFAAEAVFAIATTNPGTSATGAKFFRNFFHETNLNFYSFLGGAVVASNTKTGADFLGGVGTEFFIPGLESLGFSMEVGASLTNLSGSFVFRTMGSSFLEAGMRFYF